MLHKIYSVRDSKSQLYAKPVLGVTHGEMERAFSESVNKEGTIHNIHPQDFDLYYLGDYDDNTGKILSLDTPQHICKGVDLQRHKADVSPIQAVQN